MKKTTRLHVVQCKYIFKLICVYMSLFESWVCMCVFTYAHMHTHAYVCVHINVCAGAHQCVFAYIKGRN